MSELLITAMFQCQSITVSGSSPGGAQAETIQLHPVYGPENEPWSKFTPSGSLSMTITNPQAQGVLKVGHVYQLTLSQSTETERLEARQMAP